MFEVRNSSTALQARIGDPAAGLAADDPPGRRLLGEELGDRQVEGVRDPLDGRDRRAGDVALDLRQEALGHAGPLRHVAQRQPARLAERSDARAELEVSGHRVLLGQDFNELKYRYRIGCASGANSVRMRARFARIRALTLAGSARTMQRSCSAATGLVAQRRIRIARAPIDRVSVIRRLGIRRPQLR